jgi:hypothetical protein
MKLEEPGSTGFMGFDISKNFETLFVPFKIPSEHG